MASNERHRDIVPFAEATKVERLGFHTYKVNLNDAFCIGAVPNGGYSASCMLAAAREHLSSRNQPDTLTAHFEYPNRTTSGPAIVAIEDVKLRSGQLSTLHLTLWQGGLLPDSPFFDPSISRRTILACTTHTNLRTFSGITLPTGFSVTSAAELPSPLPDFERLKTQDADEAWEKSVPPRGSDIVQSLGNWGFYMPRYEPLVPGVLDMWIRRSSGEMITQSALPYVVDSFPYNIYAFLLAPELKKLLDAPQNPQEKERKEEANEQRASTWFPTVVKNIEVKMPLPEEGVEWLTVRVTSKQIKDGRFDLDLMVRDVDGEIIALSHHVAMILSIERNTGKKPRSSL
ncbi:hypothetical protein LSUE1_G005648 [Lachnellula suecica]|uniref:Thioesterase family protein n=1 Tax=Lachnellula suecica TaxID=602035 RepID=A0A8T9C2V0_9HELO|nr:hypothetical protein LSUE1_G005648 [Lachnellula suecica]